MSSQYNALNYDFLIFCCSCCCCCSRRSLNFLKLKQQKKTRCTFSNFVVLFFVSFATDEYKRCKNVIAANAASQSYDIKKAIVYIIKWQFSLILLSLFNMVCCVSYKRVHRKWNKFNLTMWHGVFGYSCSLFFVCSSCFFFFSSFCSFLWDT